MRTIDFLFVNGISRIGRSLVGLASIASKQVWRWLVPARRPGAEGVELIAATLSNALLTSPGGKL